MEQLCPECMGALESRDGRVAKCTIHGGQFEVLFTRSPFRVPVVGVIGAAPVLGGGAVCIGHPTVPAKHACADCGTPICDTCSFAQPGGSHVCPNCAVRRTTSGAPPVVVQPQLSAGVRCVQHPQVAATAQCKICGGFVCNTCKFDLPGGIVMCPTCATNPRTKLGSRQKKSLIGAYIAAGWTTIVMSAMFAGAFRGMSRDKESQQVLGMLLMLILVAPSIAGVGLGVAAKNQRAPSPLSVTIAIVWNSIILGGFILMMVIGIMRK